MVNEDIGEGIGCLLIAIAVCLFLLTIAYIFRGH